MMDCAVRHIVRSQYYSPRNRSRWLIFQIILLAGLATSGAVAATLSAPGSATPQQYLDATGHFDLAAARAGGLHRALGVSGYDLVVDAETGQPRLLPAPDSRDNADWSDEFCLPGWDGTVLAMAVYEDELYVGGYFSYFNNHAIFRLGRWDGAQWIDMGDVFSHAWFEVRAFVVHDGSLYVGGDFVFTAGDGGPARHVARWDGSQWHSLGQGLGDTVHALTVWDGKVVAGGYFWYNGNQSTVLHNVAYFESNAWRPFGAGTNGTVRALAVYEGDLIIGGSFSLADNHVADGVSRWNGSTFWHLTHGARGGRDGFDNRRDSRRSIGGQRNADVQALAVFQGDLIVGGSFASMEGQPMDNLARWDGGAWHEAGGGLGDIVYYLALLEDDLVVSGDFLDAGGEPHRRIARFDGADWQAMGTGADRWLTCSVHYAGEWLVGGTLDELDGFAANRAGRWTGTHWTTFPGAQGKGLQGRAMAMAVYDGDLIVAGDFTAAGLLVVENIARWDGNQWHAFGANGTDDPIRVLTVWDGQLVAGGWFENIGGVAATRIATWDGAAWHALGDGLNNDPQAMQVYGGDLIVGGEFTASGTQPLSHVARYDGSLWHDLGGGLDDEVHTLIEYEGNLIAGGEFTEAGAVQASYLAVWNGASWAEYAGGADRTVLALTEYNGDLIVGGEFDTVGGVESKRIARRREGQWEPLGDCFVGGFWVQVGPDEWEFILTWVDHLAVCGGKLYASGSIQESGTLPVNGIACWIDADQWTALGDGIDSSYTLAAFAGKLYVGVYLNAGGKPSRGIALWLPDVTPVENPPAADASVRLAQPYPNPFNPAVTIAYAVERPAATSVTVHDLRGRLVQVLADAYREPGRYRVTWNGRDAAGAVVAAGVYLIRLQCESEILTRKVVLGK